MFSHKKGHACFVISSLNTHFVSSNSHVTKQILFVHKPTRLTRKNADGEQNVNVIHRGPPDAPNAELSAVIQAARGAQASRAALSCLPRTPLCERALSAASVLTPLHPVWQFLDSKEEPTQEMPLPLIAERSVAPRQHHRQQGKSALLQAHPTNAVYGAPKNAPVNAWPWTSSTRALSNLPTDFPSPSHAHSLCVASPPAVDCFFYGFWLPMEKLPAYQASLSHLPGMAAVGS